MKQANSVLLLHSVCNLLSQTSLKVLYISGRPEFRLFYFPLSDQGNSLKGTPADVKENLEVNESIERSEHSFLPC